jgi:fatty-acyl-CoA synthase
VTQVPTILEAIRAHAARGCASRLRFGRRAEAIDYAALVQQLEARAGWLTAAGFQRGQRVALSMSNTLDAVAAVLAVMDAGGTVVPLFYRPGMRASGKDHARIVSTLRVTRAPWAFTHETHLGAMRDAALRAGGHARVGSYEELALGLPGDYADYASAGSEQQFPALIQFSAGSTSTPKGLCLGHTQLAANVRAIGRRIDFTEQDRLCSWLPLFHDMGLIGALFTTLYVGAGMTLFTPTEFLRNPLCWIEQLSIERSTITQAPQFAYHLCLQKASLQALPDDAYELSSLRLALNGAEVVDTATCEQFERTFAAYGLRPHVVQPCYGLAENCVAVTMRVPGSPRVARYFERADLTDGPIEHLAQPSATSIARAGNGTAIDGTYVRVLDSAGNALPEGHVGEIAISGQATTTALLRADGEIAALPEWVRTGDLGLFLDGELYVVGRVKEMVKRGGEAFSPTDIETCVAASFQLAPLPHVLRVGSFGYRDETSGTEEIVVMLETREFRDADSAALLAKHTRQVVLREFRFPLRDVLVVKPGTIPQTTSGKLQRLALRAQYLEHSITDG